MQHRLVHGVPPADYRCPPKYGNLLYVLRLVFLDSSLQSPGQEKDFSILFIPLRVIVREIELSVET